MLHRAVIQTEANTGQKELWCQVKNSENTSPHLNYSRCNQTESSWNQISSFEQYYLWFSKVPLSEKDVFNSFLRHLTDPVQLRKDQLTNVSLQTPLKPSGSFYHPPLSVVRPFILSLCAGTTDVCCCFAALWRASVSQGVQCEVNHPL